MRKNFTLVIESDDTIRRTICESLSFVGFFCKPFKSCDNVIDFIMDNPVSLIILDVDLDDLEAFDFIYKLKSRDPFIPLIATSAKTSNLSHLNIPITIHKPFSRMKLLGAVFEMLSSKKKIDKQKCRHRVMAP